VYAVQGEIVDASRGQHNYEILVAVKSTSGEYSIVKLSLTDFSSLIPDVVEYNFENSGIRQLLGAYDVDFD